MNPLTREPYGQVSYLEILSNMDRYKANFMDLYRATTTPMRYTHPLDLLPKSDYISVNQARGNYDLVQKHLSKGPQVADDYDLVGRVKRLEAVNR